MNLASADVVFDAVVEHAGGVVRRIPDGETGARNAWFSWQEMVLARQSQLEGVGDQLVTLAGGQEYGHFALYKIREGVGSADLELGPLGYAKDALASYRVFRDRVSQGKIREGTKFQVSLPTPVAVTFAYIAEGHQAAFEEAYERHLLREVEDMRAQIPDEELAIQWDVAVEMAMLEGVYATYVTGDRLEELTGRLVRIGDAIPPSIELGYHLCYGNRDNVHFKEPEDTTHLVDVANRVSAGVRRKIDWFHLPVPIERDDEAYFGALRSLALHPETELYLGLLHKEDGLAGARRRCRAARAVVSCFGLSTECGMGREPSDAIAGLLDLHAEACRALAT